MGNKSHQTKRKENPSVKGEGHGQNGFELSAPETIQFEDNRVEWQNQEALVDLASLGSPASNVIQKKENRTGLPDNVKTGVEQLSGYSMDDVRIHRNSGKPAMLQAHAYTQGTDIHVAPGQERHIPHEAWHVVQQKQGRVKPTLQMKGGINVNDDAGFEREADLMGQRALQTASLFSSSNQLMSLSTKKFYQVPKPAPVQGRVFQMEMELKDIAVYTITGGVLGAAAGAGIGAIVGALLGAGVGATAGATTGALIGGGIGAVGGFVYGIYSYGREKYRNWRNRVADEENQYRLAQPAADPDRVRNVVDALDNRMQGGDTPFADLNANIVWQALIGDEYREGLQRIMRGDANVTTQQLEMLEELLRVFQRWKPIRASGWRKSDIFFDGSTDPEDLVEETSYRNAGFTFVGTDHNNPFGKTTPKNGDFFIKIQFSKGYHIPENAGGHFIQEEQALLLPSTFTYKGREAFEGSFHVPSSVSGPYKGVFTRPGEEDAYVYIFQQD